MPALHEPCPLRSKNQDSRRETEARHCQRYFPWRVGRVPSSCQEHSAGRERSLPDRGSDRRKSRVSLPHAQLRHEDAETARPPHCGKQPRIAGGLLHHWIPRALVLWDFAAGGPGGGRDDRDCDGLGDVEEER